VQQQVDKQVDKRVLSPLHFMCYTLILANSGTRTNTMNATELYYRLEALLSGPYGWILLTLAIAMIVLYVCGGSKSSQ
jgi:hypothetical protein